jgi:demethylmenaquinone methyltransferase/2-methoxy-6-polyprenyl-1,4-benzoquinol methylase
MYYTNKHAPTPRFFEGANIVRYAEETIPVFSRWFGSWQVSVQRLAFNSPELTRRYDRAAPGWGRTLDRLGYPGAYETLLRRVLSEEALDSLRAPNLCR